MSGVRGRLQRIEKESAARARAKGDPSPVVMIRCYCEGMAIAPGWDLPCPGGSIYLPALSETGAAMEDLRSRVIGIGHDQAEAIMARWCDRYGGEWDRPIAASC